ncbi:hypothetical protein ACOME3_010034 [Neoechinorhynchus agilis]
MYKFTGGADDDDDSEKSHYKSSSDNWRKYFIDQNFEVNTRHVAFTEKQNGEAVHLSVIENLANVYVVVGSKNNHFSVQLNGEDLVEQLTEAAKEPRLVMARAFAIPLLEDLSLNERTNLFLNFLLHTRLTAIFEFLRPSHEHVVEFCHLPKPSFMLIAFSGPPRLIDEKPIIDSLLPLPVHISNILARCVFNLNATAIERIATPMGISNEDYRGKFDHIANKVRTEGDVIYYMDESFKTLGILKKKTIWYIVLRALREKTKSIKRLGSVGAVNAMKTRIKDIAIWQKLTDQQQSSFSQVACDFLAWYSASEVTFSMEGQFPRAWSLFITQTGVNVDALFNDRNER